MKEKCLANLLTMIVKFSFEPTLRENSKILSILQEANNYPWHIIEYTSVEKVINWFVLSTEPSIILKLPSEYLTVDNAVLA